jgi:hypothetical protein
VPVEEPSTASIGDIDRRGSQLPTAEIGSSFDAQEPDN